MTLPLIPVLAAAGGVVWVAAQPEAAPGIPTNTSPSGSPLGNTPSPSAPVQTPSKKTALAALQAGIPRANVNGSSTYSPSPVVSNHPGAVPGSFAGIVAAGVGEKLDVIARYMHAAYDHMAAGAKKLGAEKLNDALNLDPPLTENSSWKDIAAAAGGAAGAAVGAYLGGPIGAKIGAVIGAYLGVKLEEFLSKHTDEIKAWFAEKYEGIKDWVSDTASDAYDYVAGAVSGAADEIGQFFEDTF